MLSVFVEISKYLFAFLLAFYTLAAYRGSVKRQSDKVQAVFIMQNILMFLIHLLGYVILFIVNDFDIKYVFLCAAQFLYLLVVIIAYDVIYKKSSKLLVNNMCMLIVIGFIMIARLNFDKCIKQFLITVCGTVLSFFVPWMLKKFKMLRNLGWLYCIAGVVLLTVVLFGNKVYGANLVLTIGPISVQPAEFVKIFFVLFVASMYNKSTTFKQTVLVTILAAAHVIILVLSTDLGAALIFFVVYLAMLYIATKKVWYIAAGIGAGSAASVAAYHLFYHVKQRVLIWRNPWATIDTSGYQICQSLFAIGMGSWFGYGL